MSLEYPISQAALDVFSSDIRFIEAFIQAYLNRTGLSIDEIQLVSETEYREGIVRVTHRIERRTDADIRR